jgi:hypothetical protein
VIGGVFGDHTAMKIARFIMLGVVASVSACHRDSQPAAAQAVAQANVAIPAPLKKGPSAGQLTAGMVEAASQGKSQLPVLLKFDLPQRPAVGQPLDINIAVVPQIDAGPADVQVAGGDGLTVAAGMNQFNWPTVEAGQVYRQVVTVNPSAAGVLLLNLTISLKHDEMTESRVFSIPLIVEH